MASIPLPALGVRPPEQQDPMAAMARMVQLKSLLAQAPIQRQILQQQAQAGSLANQNTLLEMAARKRVSDLLSGNGSAGPGSPASGDGTQAGDAGGGGIPGGAPAGGAGPSAPGTPTTQGAQPGSAGAGAMPSDEDVMRAGGAYGVQILKGMKEVQKTNADLRKAAGDHQAAALDYIGNVANAIKAGGYNPNDADTLLAHAAGGGFDQQVQQLRSQIQQNPAMLRTVVDHAIAMSAKQREVTAAETAAGARKETADTGARKAGFQTAAQIMGPATDQASWDAARSFLMRSQGLSEDQVTNLGIPAQYSPQAAKLVASLGTEKEKTATPEMMSMQDWLAKHPGKGASDYEQAKAGWAPAAKVMVENSVGGKGMNDAALDQAAERYFQTGQLPRVYGTGSRAMLQSIMNRAGELHRGESISAATAAYEANRKSLDALQASSDQVDAFEKTAGRNLDNFVNVAGRVLNKEGSPWFNKPWRVIQANLAGDTDYPAVNAARQVALTEIAKVTNNPGLRGQLSDSGREEIMALSPQNATLNQILSVANVLKTDMANRKQSNADQIGDIQKRLNIKPSATARQNSGAATVMMKAPDGTVKPVPADQVQHYKDQGAQVVQQ
ncbi:MAG TPA: hypothetical protein VKY85_07580 [Candidatus Angelobacter sp.]|nr:hypothetical protein [Candidatus Angelobacter sp.]